MRASPHDWQGPGQCPGQAPSRWSVEMERPRVHHPCRPHSVITMLCSGFTRICERMVSWNDARVTKNNTAFFRAVAYLLAADKSFRLTCRSSQEQKGLGERALMASQW